MNFEELQQDISDSGFRLKNDQSLPGLLFYEKKDYNVTRIIEVNPNNGTANFIIFVQLASEFPTNRLGITARYDMLISVKESKNNEVVWKNILDIFNELIDKMDGYLIATSKSLNQVRYM